MKIALVFSLMILSANALAVRMCPVRTLETVSCKEAGYVSISICENAQGKISMTYKHPASPEVVMFPTEMKEEERTLSFKRIDSSSDQMELIVFKSVDDHTRGVLKLTSAGIQSQLSMRCLTRANPIVDSNEPVTVSGISSGAYMAQQFHTAFSGQVSGVGIVAGGPYWCAKGKMIDALNRCMKTSLGIPKARDSYREAQKLAENNLIDDIENLKSSRVYAISGTKDETVIQKVSDVALEVYKLLGVKHSNIRYENELAVGHAFPTLDFGNPCSTVSKPPFISNCGRDIAGEILNHLLGPLQPKKLSRRERIFSFEQLNGIEAVDIDRLSMHKTGYAYIPQECEGSDSGCRIHVAFHGCKQTLDDIQTTFITRTGYNDWAESNRIVVLYPQAEKNLVINNPNGCWDWWGYSGDNYHTKEGKQMKLVAELVEALRDGKLQLQSANLKD